MITYAHRRYGSLIIEKASGITLVKNHRNIDLDNDLLFNIETAEKIALITEEQRTQLSVSKIEEVFKCSLFVHLSPSTGWVARILNLNYTFDTPARDILAMPTAPLFFY